MRYEEEHSGHRFGTFLVLIVSFQSVVQLLSKPKFSSVEKIKTIGSTYMAAAGLTLTPVGDENKVFTVGYTHIRMGNCSKWIYWMF